MTDPAPDWDALAPLWHHYDTVGITGTVISRALAHLQPPVLYVGGGRGNYAARMSRWFGADQIVVIDRSAAMAARAAADFHLRLAVTDVGALPFRSGVFGSAFCTTGVLDFLDPDRRHAALTEMCRVVRPQAPVLITVFDHLVDTEEIDIDGGSADLGPEVVHRWPSAGVSMLRVVSRVGLNR